MRTHHLGSLEVGRIGLGAMGMSMGYSPSEQDDEQSVRTIHRALDLGVTLVDTAEIYGPYTNEELVGRAIRDRRDEVVLATKYGMVSHAGDGPGNLDSSPANVRTAVEGRGFLTGSIRSIDDLDEDDSRRSNPRFMGENFQRNVDLADEVGALAKQLGATAAQVALAWLLAQGDDVVPIPGTKRVERLEENVGADAVELTPDQVQRLTDLAPPSGEHHSESQMSAIER